MIGISRALSHVLSTTILSYKIGSLSSLYQYEDWSSEKTSIGSNGKSRVEFQIYLAQKPIHLTITFILEYSSEEPEFNLTMLFIPINY